MTSVFENWLHIVGPSLLLISNVRILYCLAWAMIAATLPRSVSCISQIHMPRPANGLFLGTAITAGPPTVAAGFLADCEVVVGVVPPRPDPPEPWGPRAEATPVSGPTVANASPSVAEASAAADAFA